MIHLSMQKNIVKKIASDVDNYAAFSEKRYQMICQIQNFLKEGWLLIFQENYFYPLYYVKKLKK